MANQITKNDTVIIVMGPTGAGKSTFIDYAVGGGGNGVGHHLKSCTDEIVISKTTRGNQSIAFVDTPGFNDTNNSDYAILTKIAEFLINANKKGFKLDRLLYLHRISDNRMAGSPLKNLELFASLCGDVAMPSVTIVTTMWRLVRENVAEQRLKELKATFWDKMIAAGGRVEHFQDTKDSALSIALALNDQTEETTPLLSHELTVDRRQLNDTEAGITLNKQLKRLIQDRREANRRLQEIVDKQTNQTAKDNLLAEMKEIDQKISEAAEKLRKLKLPFSAKVRRFFGAKAATPDIPGGSGTPS
ncbi:hypothetical protein FRC17_004962 [Serendipita sp. 399]|nr:hypothetical protein FRC17_004962 [Serendipita sp. 399]